MNPDNLTILQEPCTDINLFSDQLVHRPLLNYQKPIADEITRSIIAKSSGIITCEMPRQSGKNEISAIIEFFQLLRHYFIGGNIIKTAPTFSPQLKISQNRLISLLQNCTLSRGRWKTRDSNTIQLGKAREVFLSAQPGANVVGATADIALIVDEGQEIDPEKFNRDFSPMRAWKNSPLIVFGVRWDGRSFLENLIEVNLEKEKKDGIKRHFRVDVEQVIKENPSYLKHFKREKARLGEDHILFRTQYLLQSVSTIGDMFSPAQLFSMRGDFERLDIPRDGCNYFVGIDIGGEASGEESHDETIMVILERSRDKSNEQLRVVNCYRWQGANWETLHRELITLLNLWCPESVTVDGRGIGNACGMWLSEQYKRGHVEVYQASASSVSNDGYLLMSKVGLNKLRLFKDGDKHISDGLVSCGEIFKQLGNARRELVSGGSLRFYVPEKYGHDDILKAVSYAVRASGNSSKKYENIILEAVI
ncbi:hypothetical protein KKB99_03730 [bacterium]|nr:hypothetical protein [bacterium]MBU1025102.1 hypothetical protein [bacterium]